MIHSFVFIDESGVLDEAAHRQPFFAVGMVKISDTSKISEKLMQLHYDYFSVQKDRRNKLKKELASKPRFLLPRDLNLLLLSTRHHEYKFTHITPVTVEKYKSFIDTALEFPFEFCALVIDKTDPLYRPEIYKNYWHAYIKYAKTLCKGNRGSDESLCVIADYMNRPRDSDIYFEREINSLPGVFNTIRAHSETFALLQLCDLLLGSVIFQWKEQKGFMNQSNRARAKKEFVEHLINKFEIPNNKQVALPLAQHITINRPIYFNVWPLKLS